jgi:uncharacterized protein (TIGR02284 family)
MKKTEKVIEVLNDLIRINIDRIEGYEKEAHEEKTTDIDLRNTFNKMATESRSFVNALHAEVLRLGGAPVSKTTISGKIYLYWLDTKANFMGGYTGNDILSVLSVCESGEDAVQTAYNEALESGIEFPDNIQGLIERQHFALKASHELIRNYRNKYVSPNKQAIPHS